MATASTTTSYNKIPIPAGLSDILCDFTKEAIKSNPRDVLKWAVEYFQSLVDDKPPPIADARSSVKHPKAVDRGLTPSIMRFLHKQLGPKKFVTVEILENKWDDLALPREQLYSFINHGAFCGEFEWLKFFAIAASSLGLDIADSMKVMCNILSTEPEDFPRGISFAMFMKLYLYLAELDVHINKECVQSVVNYLEGISEEQSGMLHPGNITRPMCPYLAPRDSISNYPYRK